MLPDYMVHHAYNSKGDHPDHQRYTPSSGYAQRRTVFQHDNHSAFDREHNPTDKTQRIPESRQDGYGIRSEKLKNKPVKHTTPKPDRGKAPQQEYQGHEKKYKPVFKPEEEDRPIMSKILSYGYQRDWGQKRDEWENQQNSLAQENKECNGRQDKMVSEYQKGYHGTPPASKSRTPSNRPSRSESKADKKQADNLEKELFKLSNNRSEDFALNIFGQRIHRVTLPSPIDADTKYNILGQPIPPNKQLLKDSRTYNRAWNHTGTLTR